MLRKDYESKYSVEKKITGRESQWACRQDELIGGKPPVVTQKTPLTHVLTASRTMITDN
jgi:hypothetical protein